MSHESRSIWSWANYGGKSLAHLRGHNQLRLLFDENVPKRLRRLLPGHQISTAQEQGWGGIVNGKLLRAAEAAGFDAMLTADQNITYQQNLAEQAIALVVLLYERLVGAEARRSPNCGSG